MRKTILFSVVAVIFSMLGGLNVIAQESVGGGSGFRVSPPRRVVTIEPGQTIVERITVRNITEVEQTAIAIVEDFLASDDETGNPQILLNSETEEPTPYSIRPFVQPISSLMLAPGEEKEVLVTLSAPEDVSPGSYFGVVRFASLAEQAGIEDSTNVTLNASVGVIFLINVPGDTVDLLTLEGIGVSKDGNAGSVFSNPPDSLFLRLRNEGNTFQAPFGDIRVNDWGGDTVQTIAFNSSDTPSNVLPESVRRFDVSLENIGSFGRYTVTGFVSYGDGSNIIEINTTFWVIPWVTVGIIAVLVIGGLFFATRGIKAYNRAIIKKAKGSSRKSMK